ncbi:MAG: hypothetical protein ACK4JB_17350 [Reyranella sp.]
MSFDYADTLRRHRRLAILRILTEAPEYSANESLLMHVLTGLRITSTRDQIRTDLGWLADQGFVSTATIFDLMTATITEAGGDIAAGRRVHPDIEKPSPKRR